MSASLASALAAAAAKSASAPAPEPVTKRARPVDDLAWETMDVADLPATMQERIRTVLAIQEAERNERKAIGDELASLLDLPSHLTIRIGFKWGKFSVAIAPREPTKSGALTLAGLVAKVNALAKGK